MLVPGDDALADFDGQLLQHAGHAGADVELFHFVYSHLRR